MVNLSSTKRGGQLTESLSPLVYTTRVRHGNAAICVALNRIELEQLGALKHASRTVLDRQSKHSNWFFKLLRNQHSLEYYYKGSLSDPVSDFNASSMCMLIIVNVGWQSIAVSS